MVGILGEIMAFKSCNKCRENKSLSLFDKASNRKDGHYSICKSCRKEYRVANKEKLALEDRRNYLKNREKLLQYQREYQHNNSRALKASSEVYRNKPENRERARVRAREYYKNNRDKARLSQKAYKTSINGKALHNLHSAKRRTKLAAQTPRLTEVEKQLMLDYYKVSKMLSLMTQVKYHVDHVIPIAHGGLHHPSNLQVITAEENLKKGSKYGV